MSTPARGWWEHRWLVALLVAALGLPILFTETPPLVDLPGHMGRYRVQLDLATSMALQANWDFHWQLIGNLGVDLLIVPLSAVFGLERAVWIVALLLPPVMGWGIVRVARALHGRITPLALVALPFAAAFPYQFGFVNFWLGSGLALHIYASWIDNSVRPRRFATQAIFALAIAALWVVHVYAWALLAILIGCAELVRNWRHPRDWLAMATTLLARLWPVALPLAVMFAWRETGANTLTIGFFLWETKLRHLRGVLNDQNALLDAGTLLFAGLALLIALYDARGRIDLRLALALVAFLIVQAVMPFQLFGSAYADARLWPMIFIAALLMVRPAKTDSMFLGSVVATAAIALLITRVAVSADGYSAYARDFAQHLQALDKVERGSRVAILTDASCGANWRQSRLQHLGSMAIVRRDAFVNAQWDVPGAQLLLPLGGKGTAFNADPSQFVRKGCRGEVLPSLAAKIAAVPADRFDYIWLIDFDIAALPRYPGLTPLYADQRTALYAIEKTPAR